MRVNKFVAGSVMAVGLTACMTDEVALVQSPIADRNILAQYQNAKSTNLGQPYIQKAVIALEEGNYIEAQAGFNKALKFDPSNPHLHFLNGLTYHLRADVGDTSQYELAEAGYHLTLQYDSSNYWAAYQLGHIKFGQQRYRQAQEAFAYALLYDGNNPLLLKALAAASYYSQDLASAEGAILKAIIKNPADPETIQKASLISAAVGKFKRADLYRQQYSSIPGIRKFKAQQLTNRLNDWQRFHARSANVLLAQNPFGPPSSPVSSGDDPSPSASSSDDSNNSSDDSSSDSSDSSSGTSTSTEKTAGPPQAKMTLVDVVIIRSEERQTTNKGVNLLNGLTMTLPATFVSTRTANDPTTGPNTLVNVFTWSPTIGTTTYSLNIFNDINDRNEVLARPSLIALDGQQSEFFTGATFHVQLTGGSGTDGSVTDVLVGLKLSVTPTFKGKDTVQLAVSASRAFIEDKSSAVGFSTFAQTTKNSVSANVTMKFDTTLVLSGISEKETERVRDGVPILQDIPGLQYLFSNETTLDFNKSVLILVTPHKPRYTDGTGKTKNDPSNPVDADIKQSNLAELKKRPGWFKQASNLDAVFFHLKDARFFKEFRSGDVRLEKWDTSDGIESRIKRALDFLYY